MFARKRENFGHYALEGIQETHDERHTCKHSPIWGTHLHMYKAYNC